MASLDASFGNDLYERLAEIRAQDGLTPRERVPRYRTVLEHLFAALTRDAGRSFEGLHARSSFIFKQTDVPKPVRDSIHNLRRYANKVVHEDERPTLRDEFRCLVQLGGAVAFFTGLPVPPALLRFPEPPSPEPENPAPPERGRLHSFRAVVLEVPSASADQPLERRLRCDTDAFGEIELLLLNRRSESGFGSDLTPFADLVSPFDTIYVREAEASAGSPGVLELTEKGNVVLEPDYLVDVSALSEAMQVGGSEPLIVLLKRFLDGSTSDKMLIGHIANQVLDEVARNRFITFGKAFERAMRMNALGMLSVAVNNERYDRNLIEGMYRAAEAQLACIMDTVKRLRSERKSPRFSIEPTFISAELGLTGRLDLLIEDEDTPRRHDVVELKSGRAPSHEPWPNHLAQALLYDLLLTSVYPDRTNSLSAILYSAVGSGSSPLQMVNTDRYLDKQEVIMTRNRIVAHELRLANGDASPVFDLARRPLAAGPGFRVALHAFDGDRIEEQPGVPEPKEKLVPLRVPRFLETDLMGIQAAFGEMTDLERRYFLAFVHFTFGEMRAAKIGAAGLREGTGGFARLWRASAEEKKESYDMLVLLEIVQVTEEFEVTLRCKNDLFAADVTSFRPGDIAVLYPTPSPDQLHPLRSQILKCTVLHVGKDTIEVRLVHRQLDRSLFARSRFWALEPDHRESSYRESLRGLMRFLRADAALRERVLGLIQPLFDTASTGRLAGLNEKQNEVAQRALAARDYFLIEGPPGTGKTARVLCSIVKEAVRQGENVAVLAFTNRAVDEICLRLTELGVRHIRLGRAAGPQSWGRLSDTLSLDELYRRVTETSVFVSTQASFAGSLDLLKLKSFRTLILDEASQLLEPQLVGLLRFFERFILIGDENQLPPVVLQEGERVECRDVELNRIGMFSHGESLFARLLANAKARGWDACHGLLEVQYRMHREIADFPNRRFYGGRLCVGSADQEGPVAWPGGSGDRLEALFAGPRLLFIPTKRDSKSKVSDEEAELCAALVATLRSLYGDAWQNGAGVGVITPFRAQMGNIRKLLDGGADAVTVDTVERYQGSERDVILVSFAVKSPVQLRMIQSLTRSGVDRKLNVALTRARRHLVLMGHEETLSAHPLLRDLIGEIRANGGYRPNPLKADVGAGMF